MWKSNARKYRTRSSGFVEGSRINLANSGNRSLCPAPPDDVATGRRSVQLSLAFAQPGGKAGVPLLVGPDPQRFEIPAVLAVVLGRQLGPQVGGFGRFACAAERWHIRDEPAARDRGLVWRRAASTSRFSSRACRSPVMRMSGSDRRPAADVNVLLRPARHQACSVATVPAPDSADCRIETASRVPAQRPCPPRAASSMPNTRTARDGFLRASTAPSIVLKSNFGHRVLAPLRRDAEDAAAVGIAPGRARRRPDRTSRRRTASRPARRRRRTGGTTGSACCRGC